MPLLTILSIWVLVLGPTACSEKTNTPSDTDNGDTGPTATFYVSPSGSDSNNGSRHLPWATPGHASRQLQAGDTLVIMGGRYTLHRPSEERWDEEMIQPVASGTQQGWITIKGEEGNRPILAGRDNLNHVINIEGLSYIRVENLEITHDDKAPGEAAYCRNGINQAGRPSTHIVLKDLYIHHIDEFAVNVQDVDDLQIIDCRLEYCGTGAVGGPNAEHGGVRNVLIQGCSLSWSGHYWQGGDGSNRPYDRPDGLGFEESAGPVLVVDTVVEHNYGDGLDSKCANTTFRRCMVANNTCDSIKLWGDNSIVENCLVYGRGDGDPERSSWAAIVIHTEVANARFQIINSTVDDILGGNYIMYVQCGSPWATVAINLTITNTIFRGVGESEGSSHIYIGTATVLSVDHSLFWLPTSEFLLERGSGDTTDATYDSTQVGELGVGNIYADPLFIRPAWGAEGDYHLSSSSPAINAGTGTGAPTDDIEGDTRDSSPNIGAYE